MSKIEELKAAFRASTQREWGIISAGSGKYPAVCCLTDAGNDTRSICEVDTVQNAKFIALAHNMMPLLLEAAQLLIELSDNYKAKEDDATFDKALGLAARLNT